MIYNFSTIQVHFVFCWLNFILHFPYLIKYNILFIIIIFWLGYDRQSGLFFLSPLCFCLHSRLSSYLLRLFILFRSCCSHARVFRKTWVHEFPISYSHTEWYLLFFWQCNYKCTMFIRSEKLEIVVH